MNQEIIIKDKLVHLCVLETDIKIVHNEYERNEVCMKMCDYAKQDGVDIINQSNGDLCNSCEHEKMQSKLLERLSQSE